MVPERVNVILMPGEHFTGGAQHVIRTLLGSCVSMILWHPRLHVGSMSHFVIAGRGPREHDALNGRYGEDALALMLEELAGFGVVKPSECQAKVFGGGAMFDAPRRGRLPDVGRKNGEAALALLRQHRIQVVSESLYDAGHRQIVFEVGSGDVWVRHAKLGGSKALATLDEAQT